ncbi:hypothetical protein L228DRAFT_259228 [Xylona heveae TC161]|uniref:Uncharacterized protein n=1 Tax=Xylona heveae (strain CBS 132557 / TC161) TaxID=1328760 RepID=A0A165HUF1_XYLHT|nr:hypothetical protein L228DRAFT_259228 [Xylona heveae TC161]KZF23940.1 hypothetical protein L228DRAFT_259228 [Xylona heveae TC161]
MAWFWENLSLMRRPPNATMNIFMQMTTTEVLNFNGIGTCHANDILHLACWVPFTNTSSQHETRHQNTTYFRSSSTLCRGRRIDKITMIHARAKRGDYDEKPVNATFENCLSEGLTHLQRANEEVEDTEVDDDDFYVLTDEDSSSEESVDAIVKCVPACTSEGSALTVSRYIRGSFTKVYQMAAQCVLMKNESVKNCADTEDLISSVVFDTTTSAVRLFSVTIVIVMHSCSQLQLVHTTGSVVQLALSESGTQHNQMASILEFVVVWELLRA